MAQQSEAGIPRAGKRKWGYDPAQVDEFLEKAHKLYDSDDDTQLTQRDIQNVSFDLTRGGYVIAQVDAALTRLERAVVDKQTQREISREGRVAWKARTEELYREIARHVEREERERFAPGRGGVPSYDRRQVDRLADRIVDKCAAALAVDESVDDPKLDKVTSDTVANAVFTQRKGKKGYDERQVDYFLNSCVELLSRIESFDRLADYISADGDADGSAASLGSRPRAAAVSAESASTPSPSAPAVPVASGSPVGAAAAVSSASPSAMPAGPVAPLFSTDARFRRADDDDAPRGYAPQGYTPVAGNAESFDALSQAEQHLFASASRDAVSSPAPAVVPVEPVVTRPVTPAVPVSSQPVQPISPVQPVAARPAASQPIQPVQPIQPAAASAPLFPTAQPAVQATPVTPRTTPSAPVDPAPYSVAQPAPAVTPAPASPVSASPAPAARTPFSAPTAPIAMPPSFSTPPATPAHRDSASTVPPSFAPAASASGPSAPASAHVPPAASVPAAGHAAGSDGHAGRHTTSSLAALAQMAEASQEFPKVNGTAPFEPHMPSLDVPNTFTSMPAVTAAPASGSAPASPTPTSAAPIPSFEPAAKPARTSFSLLSTDDNDVDIPELSFPALGGLGIDEKKEQ